MSKANTINRRFGQIAIELKYITQEKLDRALMIQRCIHNRTQVDMPIGKVLKEMGVLSQEQIDSVLEAQRTLSSEHSQAGTADTANANPDQATISGLDLTISKDRLAAELSPNGDPLQNATLEMVKELFKARGIVCGLISDEAILVYLNKDPLPIEPFRVAYGKPPEESRPPEIRYHFDIDPLRIGTVLEDGSMDWKNRGDVPEVKAGDLLAEKTGGKPGKSGTSVLGAEIAPPKIKEPQLKCAKGAERSEDGRQVFAKFDGMPKLTPDGRITVMSMLPIDGDIGLETGHVDFDGYIEVNGGVCTGYRVKGRGLSAREIQNAEVELEEDLVSYGGVYGSTIRVGGNVKASHVHNSDLQIIGDLLVDKEIIGSNVEVNGRVMVDRGKIIGSSVTAKKGIQVRDVGTEASPPSELIVGVDRPYEREMQKCKESLAELEHQTAELNETEETLKKQLDDIGTELGEAAQEQDKYMVQRRTMKEKLVGPKAVTDEEQRAMLAQVVEELTEKEEAIDQRVNELMAHEDDIRNQLGTCQSSQVATREQTEAVKNQMVLLDEALKADPGIAVVKVSGKVYSRTTIAGNHKKVKLSEDMQSVRISETKEESGANAWQIKISNLR